MTGNKEKVGRGDVTPPPLTPVLACFLLSSPDEEQKVRSRRIWAVGGGGLYRTDRRKKRKKRNKINPESNYFR